MNRTDHKPTPPRGLAAVLSGAFLIMAGPGMAHQPPGADGAPEGITRATIVSEGDVHAMNAMVLDAPQPALMIRYQGEEALIVYDSDNKPFLRFAENRVEASTRSRHWQALPQSDSYQDQNGKHWVQVSGSGSFGWVDPRLSVESKVDRDTVTDWRIPVRQGQTEPSAITGQLSWRALKEQDTETHH